MSVIFELIPDIGKDCWACRLFRQINIAATNMATTAIGMAIPIAIVVMLLSFPEALTTGAAVLVRLFAVAVEETMEELVVIIDTEEDLEGIASSGIWAITVAAGTIRKILVAVWQHSNDPAPFPPGSQQLICYQLLLSNAMV